MSKLKIAIQKSGRLYDDSVKLLKDCGIDLKNGVNKLKAECDNFPMEVYFLRDDDIPQYVEDAVADIGIVGENVLYEKEGAIAQVDRVIRSHHRVIVFADSQRDEVPRALPQRRRDHRGHRLNDPLNLVLRQIDKRQVARRPPARGARAARASAAAEPTTAEPARR